MTGRRTVRLQSQPRGVPVRTPNTAMKPAGLQAENWAVSMAELGLCGGNIIHWGLSRTHPHTAPGTRPSGRFGHRAASTKRLAFEISNDEAASTALQRALGKSIRNFLTRTALTSHGHFAFGIYHNIAGGPRNGTRGCPAARPAHPELSRRFGGADYRTQAVLRPITGTCVQFVHRRSEEHTSELQSQ